MPVVQVKIIIKKSLDKNLYKNINIINRRDDLCAKKDTTEKWLKIFQVSVGDLRVT